MASGEQAEVAETIAQREIAPTVLSSPTNGAVPQPPAPPPAEKSTNKRYSRVGNRCPQFSRGFISLYFLG